MRDARVRMVNTQIRNRGIRDERVLQAMEDVPRHVFIPMDLRREAHGDHPVHIGLGQTISQPYIVALMLEAMDLSGTERVLEIGTGSGYQTALLLRLAREVISVERHSALRDQALTHLGSDADRLTALAGDGTLGHPERSPYDAVVVTAAGPKAPQPLLDQLAEGGRLVMPVGDRQEQMLVKIERRGQELLTTDLCPCRFVPLIGAHGFPE